MARKGVWYVWVVVCRRSRGWHDADLWGDAPRVYRTRREACAARDALAGAGCWGDDEAPEFCVERRPVVVAAMDDSIAAEVEALAPPAGTRIPASVLRAAAAEYGVAADAHGRAAARLRGASSATHSHEALRGWAESEGRRWLDLVGTGARWLP